MRRHQEPSVAYDDLAAAAYAVSRMPACYAVVKRIMEEIAFSQSGWRPRTMLDFGAGPATAAWAAAEVSFCLSFMTGPSAPPVMVCLKSVDLQEPYLIQPSSCRE